MGRVPEATTLAPVSDPSIQTWGRQVSAAEASQCVVLQEQPMLPRTGWEVCLQPVATASSFPG